METTKKSVLSEAIVEFNELMEAAKSKAKEQMASELPEKFNKILNEHLEKLDKMKNNIQKEKNKINESKADKTFIKEPKDEKEVGKTNTKEVEKDDEEVDSTLGDTFNKEPKKGKKVNESVEDDIDLTDFSMEELQEVFDSADDDDDFDIEDDELNTGKDFDLDDIEAELAKMDDLSEEFEVDENVNDPYTKLKKLQKEMNAIIDSLYKETGDIVKETDPIIQEFNEKMSGIYGENYKGVLGADYDKLLDLYKKQNNGDTKYFDDDDVIEISMDEEEDLDFEDEIEEAHGVSLSNNKLAGSNVQPRSEYAQYKKDKLRYALQKEQFEKRINSLVSENKKNKIELKKLKNKTVETQKLMESYRDVIGKYRQQLTEMVVFNTNLSHVNNLLINEDFNFTNEEKKQIVEKFKPVQSIDESEQIYNKILKEKKEVSDELISESINKNSIIGKSSKENLGETVEKSTYKNEDHLDKIKRVMKYVEK